MNGVVYLRSNMIKYLTFCFLEKLIKEEKENMKTGNMWYTSFQETFTDGNLELLI